MATTYYYAYINSSNIVEQIVDLPSPITAPNYISIKSHDVSLIGKRYNAQTGQFEVVTWFCYAMLNEKDIVTQVIRRETALPDVPSNVIVIQTYDEGLVGKWYNRANGTFSAPPIHVLAEHSSDKINVGTQDLWLTDKLGSMDSKVSTIDGKVSTIDGKVTTMDGKLGTVDGKFSTIDRRLGLIDGLLDRSIKCKIPETKDNTIFPVSAMTKHYRYQFQNPVPGYLPKYVFMQFTWGGEPFEDAETLSIWLVRNGTDTDMYTICRQGQIVRVDGTEEFKGSTNFLFYPKANLNKGCFTLSDYQNRMRFRGGDAFTSMLGLNKVIAADIGKFKYDETGIEFDIQSDCQAGAVLSSRFCFRAFAY